MTPKINKLLLTGPPGCGKTTAVLGVIEMLRARRLAGFCTGEIREHGRRVGGQVATLSRGQVPNGDYAFDTRYGQPAAIL
jgi:nucleoside-triphosphatase